MKEKSFYHLQCVECHKIFDERDTATRCLDCHGSLDVIYDYDFILSRLNSYGLKHSPISAMKYVDFYPIKDLSKVVSLKEGGTPLYHAKNLGESFGLSKVYVKNEGANPTGVFKDRGTMVEVTKAIEMGAKAMCLASSGNMAASCAAYAALAKIPCYVLVPEGTPVGKLSQTISYGARVLQIRAPYSRCAELAEETAKKHNFYLAGDYVFRGEGQKSQAFEIIEQLDWKAPDYVIVPVGCGTNMAAICKGFKEFKDLGFIDRMPKMIGVQPVGCAPVCSAFDENRKTQAWDKIDTVCSAVSITEAVDGNKLLNYIHESKGFTVTVTDEETLQAEQILAKEQSIFVEPSGALSTAAFLKLAKEGRFHFDDTVVISTTGNGLKDPITVLKYLAKPATLEPQIGEIDRFLENKLYNLRAGGVSDREKTLWDGKIPEHDELAGFIEKEFGINIKKDNLEKIVEEIDTFSKKGKDITEQDLQGIIETTLKEFSSKDAVLTIKDYTLNIFKVERPKASVILDFMGEEIKSESEGVGPVDALIQAIRNGVEGKDTLDCELTDYQVTIHSGGANAAVEVRIFVKDKFDNSVVGSATSPDIIQASMNAFIRAYNALYWKTQ